MTSSLILFRYHAHDDVCVQTLDTLKHLNPGIPIHGLYGGADPASVSSRVTNYFQSNWTVPIDDPNYKWKNGDLCARWWYKDHGRNLDFDHAYFLEWDMQFLKPLASVYGDLEKGVNYATVFGDFNHVKQTRWYWMRDQYGYETDQLIDHLAKRNKPVNMETLSYSIMGGTVFCRDFLEQYSGEPVPSYSNDEVRFAFYSAAFGITVKDNGMRRKSDAGINTYFADGEIFDVRDLDAVLAKDGDIIHPFRIVVPDLKRKLGFLEP